MSNSRNAGANNKTTTSGPSATPTGLSIGQIIGIALGSIILICCIIMVVGSAMNQPWGFIFIIPLLQCLCNCLIGLCSGDLSMGGGKKNRYEYAGGNRNKYAYVGE